MTETHSYDGKWADRLSRLRGMNLAEDPKFHIPVPPSVARRVSDMLVDNTVDPSNGVTPGFLTRALAARLRVLQGELNPAEFAITAALVFEQFADIDNGPCIQGRTTRIFQVLAALVGV